jgi:hypothetical protein
MPGPDQKLFDDAYAEAKRLVDGYRGDPNDRTYRFALALIKSVEGRPSFDWEAFQRLRKQPSGLYD